MTFFTPTELKDHSNLRDYVRHCWGDPVRSTVAYDQYFARWRDDGSSPSFTVYNSGFKDYGGEGLSGSILDFVMYDQQCSFKDACESIRQWLGGGSSNIVLTSKKRSRQRNKESATLPSLAWQKAVSNFVTEAHQQLVANADVMRYLTKARGLTPDTIAQAQLGWSSRWHKLRIEGNLISIAPGIIIPWYSNQTLAAVRVRLPVGSFSQFIGDAFSKEYAYLDGYSKYLSVTGSTLSACMYSATDLTNPHTIFIVEGEFDALLAAQHLREQSIAWQVVTRGSASNYHNLPPRIVTALQGCHSVYSLLDQDHAGQQATASLDKQLPNHLALTLPTGGDITDYLIDESGDILSLILPTWVRTTREGRIYQSQSVMLPAHQFDQRGLPDHFIAALAIATGGRSSLALVAHHLIAATGKHLLPSTVDSKAMGCSQKDMLAHMPIARSTLSKALPSLEKLGIVRVLESKVIIDTTSPQCDDKTTCNIHPHQGGRPAVRYHISLDRTDLAAQLVEALQMRLLEYTFSDLPVVPIDLLAIEADLDAPVFASWCALHDDLLASEEVMQRWQSVEEEMLGKGSWVGWRQALYEPKEDHFTFWSWHDGGTDNMPTTVSAWRTAIMGQLVIEQPTRFNAEWCRLLGTLSPQTVHNTRARLGLISEPNYASTGMIQLNAEILCDHNATKDALYQKLYNSARGLGGRVIRAECHVSYHHKPIHYHFLGVRSEQIIQSMALERHSFIAVVFVVQTASTYRLPTAEELEIASCEDRIEDTTEGDDDTLLSTTIPVDEVQSHTEMPDIDILLVDPHPAPINAVETSWLRANLQLQYLLVVQEMPPENWSLKHIILNMLAHYETMDAITREARRHAIVAYCQDHHL
ncbi:MAG: toprim domain-containing protein [Chloroflexota bacterium]